MRKTATEAMARKKVKCCVIWGKLVRSINVADRFMPSILHPEPIHNALAEVMEKLLKEFFGNYCPCCGKKL